MTEVGIEPTYVGKNENLKFIVPRELFRVRLQSDKQVDRETANGFSKYIQDTFKGFQKGRETKYGNEDNVKTETTPEFWNEFEEKAMKLGVDLIGYTPVIEEFVFYNLKIYGTNCIILGMEMQWNSIKDAPSINCGVEAFRVYYELGEITIQLTEFLKEQGYKSEAHHPFGGKLLFPPHAVAAGLGFMGRNGLVITPEYGPRQRWAIISTDADIPFPIKKDLDPLEDFCKNCGACVRECRGGAAYDTPIIHEDSPAITHIDRQKCIDSLVNNNYCSYCLKVCPLGNPKKVIK
jgi:ferredoxin